MVATLCALKLIVEMYLHRAPAGLVLVVSPLIALMRDQLSRLPLGLPGAMLQGGMSRTEVSDILDRARAGELRVLYVAPEKLAAASLLGALREMGQLPLVCVDEAHCMAEWGHGFRPAYFRWGRLLGLLPARLERVERP